MKLTRHNGRSGKHGIYNPKHNDRRFNLSQSDHIDAERVKRNIYWDCYRGITTSDNYSEQDISFEQVELRYYKAKYGDFIFFQNERNVKNRHPERNRTVEDLLKNNKTCPEETIYQIGTLEEAVSAELLMMIANDFFEEMDRRFGSHVHILDWALHLDEGTPHIHERHVFDCKNKYGELCPQQEKALEALDISLPKPEQPKGKHNNRKQTFDAVCRTILFDICKKYGLHLDEEPVYGGRKYLEKQDYILEKQKQIITEKEQALSEITMKLEEAENLVEEIAENAYEKACEAITEKVFSETQKQSLETITNYQKWINSPERNISENKKAIINKSLDVIQIDMKKRTQKMLDRVKEILKAPIIKEESKIVVKEKARKSIKAMLERNRKRLEEEGNQRKKTKQKDREH